MGTRAARARAVSAAAADTRGAGAGTGRAGRNGTRRILYRGGRIHSPASPFATAMLVEDGRIAWLGSDPAADALAAEETVDLDDALVTPAFVDAHVHVTATGLALDGLDLSRAPSLAHALDQLAEHVRRRPSDVVLGTNWDETAWPEGRPPTAAELDRAAGGVAVYLSRVDGHGAVVSSALAARCGAPGRPGWLGDGRCRGEAHHAARAAAYDSVSAGQRRAAQRQVRAHAAALGIAALHEMAGPEVSSADDLSDLLALAAAEPGPVVHGYWAGEIDTAVALGAGIGGDLFVDGSLGSRTAALRAPYADAAAGDAGLTGGGAGAGSPAAGNRGLLHLDADAVSGTVVQAAEAGLQTGFHAIGDAALDTVLDGFERAADKIGLPRILAGRHRVEHCEMADAAQIARMARLGLTAVVQPAFDACWGGRDGMYAQRLGADRAGAMNPFAAMAAAGVVLALSSDAPVTPLDPWGGVRAAVAHHTPSAALSARAAFAAATRGGWRAARADGDGSGLLAPGAPATFAVWQVAGELVVQVPDSRVAAWSTDPRAAVAGLPDLDGPTPTCVRTVVRGTVIHDLL
ncbi:Amidohydrolase 3 [Candidatus Protofrankia datiscae]|uniref:Amidohydrolase 3 n=2 Tax=Frankiaceae TaxID=74712 RepID=F8B0K1_9ACTN|nr:Amidohydrolase 3 [Candidatus Protofrankia datiscae]